MTLSEFVVRNKKKFHEFSNFFFITTGKKLSDYWDQITGFEIEKFAVDFFPDFYECNDSLEELCAKKWSADFVNALKNAI
jgi:hypothetical protein